VNVFSLGCLPAFCHATVAGDFIYVSGSIELVEGGTRAETTKILQNLELIPKECGAPL